MEMRVGARCDLKLIGRGGVEINKLRKELDVVIRCPREEDGPENADRIILTGYEDKVNAARDRIQSIIDAEVKFSFAGKNVSKYSSGNYLAHFCRFDI